MDKRKLRQEIRWLQRVRTWQLLVMLLLLLFIAATFLRLNNIGMVQRRDAVLAADKAGDAGAIQDRLYDLQRYASEHMNANTDAFYLEHQYKREAQRRLDAATTDANPNGNINAKADAVCKPRYTVWSQAYVQCFTDELSKYPPSPDPVQNVKLPSTSEYRYSFVSPLWSSDFAGWTVMLCGLLAVIILVRIIGMLLLRILVRRHYRVL